MSLLLLARSTAHSENTLSAVPSLGPKSLFQWYELPRGEPKNYPAEPNSQLIAFRERERGEKEVEAGGSYWA